VSPEADLNEAHHLMAQHQLDRILVVEGESLLGSSGGCWGSSPTSPGYAHSGGGDNRPRFCIT
jgi:hypothetical protein